MAEESGQASVASVELPDHLVKEIAKELGIDNESRIPRHLVVTGIRESRAEALGIGREHSGFHVAVVA